MKPISILFLLFIISFLGLSLTRCSKIANDGIPSYIQIDTIAMAVSADSQGAPAIYSKLCWIEVGPIDGGAFQLPFKIPVLQSGKTKIRVFAGVYKNAISEYAKYPFTDYYETEVTLTPKESVTIQPVVKYKASAKFSFIEDFEYSPVFNDFVKIQNPDSDAKGKYYGMLQLNSANEKKTISTTLIQVPFGKEAWLEFDYKTDDIGTVFFVNSFYANQSDDTDVLLQLSSSNKWKRVYIPISDDNNARKGLPFNLMFILIKKDDQAKSSILIDNIKIIHF